MVYLEWFFPAYFPALLIVLKWLVLFTMGRYTLASTIVDVPFASLTFDLWAIITKLQGQPLRPSQAITQAESRREGIVVVVALLVHLGVYLFGVWAWLVATNALVKWVSSVVAIGVGALIPLLLLGWPDDKIMEEGGGERG